MEPQKTNAHIPTETSKAQSRLRSIAIIAHVDHGKTTLVDKLLRQTGAFRANQEVVECVMDSSDLERERAITILAKVTAIDYDGYHINIIDTPGHADFGGEVERILGMVDSVILVVDAGEGPMPQTRFVLAKALEQGLKPIVVINKIDRPNIDPNVAVDQVLDLFLELGATEEQALFPYVFASGRQGTAKLHTEDNATDMKPLLDLIVSHCPPSAGDPNASLQMRVSILDHSKFLGGLAIGLISNGKITVGQQVVLLKENNRVVKGKITKLLIFDGLKRVEATEASAGEIVVIAGFEDFDVSDTIASPESPVALPRIHIDPPTLTMEFQVNDSPFAGREGQHVTSRLLGGRLLDEVKTNVALRVEKTDNTSVFEVKARGDLGLGILIEEMRREGFELAVSRPKVIVKSIDGQDCEPYEKLVINVEEEYSGAVIEELGQRRAEMVGMQVKGTRALLEFIAPTRGLLGFRSLIPELTKGEAIVNQGFLEFRPWCGDFAKQRPGVLVSCATGEATEYALEKLKERGSFFIAPGAQVYEGMIIGQNTRLQDMPVNPCNKKPLTNVRTTASEGISNLTPPTKMSLERCLTYIADDELVEITPRSIRMRKRTLRQH